MLYHEIEDLAIPKLGFGTWEMKGRDAREAVADALEIGYRHIDTAQAYENQQDVGAAIAASGVPRTDLFVTTKVWPGNYQPSATFRGSVERSLEQLDLAYVDLLLLHWPHPDAPLEQTLELLAEARDRGRARLVGVSNFTTDLLDRAVDGSRHRLAVNQVEYHPYLDQRKVLERVRAHDMALTAYSPLARGDVAEDELLGRIGERHGKTPAQVALRWLLQQPDVLAIPKSEDSEHAAENFAVFDFELSDVEVKQIAGLARPDGRRVDPDFAPAWDEAS